MPTLLVILQNPYDKGRLQTWNPTVWKQEFLSSRSGVRLKLAIPDQFRIHYSNANPKVGNGANAFAEANHGHLRRVFSRIAPDIVLACGKSACEAAVQLWQGNLVCIPHPAYRLVTNHLFFSCREILENWNFNEPKRLEIQQLKGSVAVVSC